MSQLICRYRRASGDAFNDCVFVGRRYRADIGPGGEDGRDRDHCILRNEPVGDRATTHANWWFEDFITDIWRTRGGAAYATGAALEGVYYFEDPADTSRLSEKLVPPDRLVPEGVWGLDDGPVYVWGTRVDAQRQRTHHVAVWEGGAWRELPYLLSPITSVHGVSPSCLFAVGYDGMVAKWNGDAWRQLGPQSPHIVHDVHVASEDEIYAVDFGGQLLEGNANEVSVVATNPHTDDHGPKRLHAVAKFKGQLYAGSEEDGLMRRNPGGPVEAFKPKIDVRAMESRENLIITCANMIAGTSDNLAFAGAAVGSLAEISANRPLPVR